MTMRKLFGCFTDLAVRLTQNCTSMAITRCSFLVFVQLMTLILPLTCAAIQSNFQNIFHIPKQSFVLAMQHTSARQNGESV